jgi:hypothetical protein
MFVRQKRNRSGLISVQVIDKTDGYRVVKTMGTATDPVEVILRLRGAWEVAYIARRQSGQYDRLFPAGQREQCGRIWNVVRNP